jgi:mono/diheme cytochrome c family protein
MGFFLSKEGGYDETILFRHKLFGVITAILAYGMLLIYRSTGEKKNIFGITTIATTLLLVVASHFGSNLTHGEGFVWQPLRGEEKLEEEKITDSSTLFAAAIRPVLKRRCFSCHNASKAKGKLVMTSDEKLLAGGKNGPIWKAGDAMNSHIIQNINLPEDDKKHMPPADKPQLKEEEIKLLYDWIQSGADIKKQLREYSETDSLKVFATKFISSPTNEVKEKEYPFSAASAETIQKLNDPFCSVFPLSQHSPALQADFFVREKYNPQKLEELLKVKEQLVVLNLANMPVTDAEIKTVSKFTNLEKLVLNNSSVTNKGIAELVKLKLLQSLSLAGTGIDKKAIPDILKFRSLKEVFAWKTGITGQDIEAIKNKNKEAIFNMGYVPEKGEVLTLTPPVIKNETVILSENETVELKHQIPGVVIRYTTDGTIPDSTTSPVYKEPFTINGYTTIKARAIKNGWYSSPVLETSFYKKGIQPQRAELLTTPNEKYKGEGGITLIDSKKGTIGNFTEASWLGFREQPFSAVFYFEKPQTISNISISYALSVQAYIMPPTEIEIWGGENINKLKLLKKIYPPQITKEEKNVVKNEAKKIEFPPISAQCFKIIAKNITKLPTWHPGKGQKGWVFIDEIFFN